MSLLLSYDMCLISGSVKANLTFSDAAAVNAFSLSNAMQYGNNDFRVLTHSSTLSSTSPNTYTVGSNFARQLLAAKINLGT